MKKNILLLISLLFIIGCSSKDVHLNTVKKVDIKKYLGTWYEIARYEHSFEKDCKNVVAIYTLKDNNSIQVVNKCTDIKTNKIKEVKGSAYSIDKTNTKLKVTFFWPFYGDYWIIDLDNKYTYAVIGEPSRKYFWILSRSKQLKKEIKKEILKKLKKYGYSSEKIVWTIQDNIL